MDFICQVCKREYQTAAVFLPCGFTACDFHLKNNDLDQCVFCGSAHRIGDGHRYLINKPIEINMGKKRLRESITRARERLDDFRRIQDDPNHFVNDYFDKLVKQVHAREAEIIQSVQGHFDAVLERIGEIRNNFRPLVFDKPRMSIQPQEKPDRQERKRSSVIDTFKNKFKSSETGPDGKRNSVIDDIRNKLKGGSSEQNDAQEKLKRLKKVDLDRMETDLNTLVNENDLTTSFASIDLDLKLREAKRQIDDIEKQLTKVLTDNLLDKTSYELSAGSYLSNLEETFGRLVVKKRESGACLRTISAHENSIRSMIANKDGEVITASADKTIRVHHVDSGHCLRVLAGHEGAVFSVIKGRDGRLFSCSSDRSIRIWDVVTGLNLKTLIGHKDAVIALTCTADGKLISGSKDKT
jgi:hypothetical protein